MSQNIAKVKAKIKIYFEQLLVDRQWIGTETFYRDFLPCNQLIGFVPYMKFDVDEIISATICLILIERVRKETQIRFVLLRVY